jgi:pyruvate/2-oxoglutarate dehydrogenase complex dihydrolipoamide dehydrogenase (E3) component
MNALNTTDAMLKESTEPMEKIKTDILIIGAGSGGLSVAAGASQMGADVVLLEGHKMGGDCLNFGCVPSKALIAAGKQAHAMSHGAKFGVTPVMPEVSYAAAKDHVHKVIDTIAPVDSQERFEGMGVRVIREFGKFIDAKTVQAGPYQITARRVVISTGSRPFVPPIPGLDTVPYETNETLFDLREQPEHLIIIGGGPIGLEMAQAHVRLGSKVTVLEGAKALGRDDPEMAEVVLNRLRAEGIEIAEGQIAEKIAGSAGAIEVHTKDGSVFGGSHLLMAVGRQPNVDKLDLEKAGIEYDRRGVKTDMALKTTNSKVYAIGDAAGRHQFTHVAGYHGATIIRSMLFGLPAKIREDHIPYATYTDPELAQVGLTEAQAREAHGDKLEVVRFPYHENDRAIAEGKTEGLIKVMIVKGRPVGASIAGAHAGELIQTWSLVLANKLKIGAVAAMIAPYPTLAEINKRAAGQYYVPRLFDNPTVKRVVRFVQKVLP